MFGVINGRFDYQACVIVVIAKGRNNDNNAGLTPFYAGKTLGEGPG